MDEFGQRMFVAEFAVSRKVFSALSKELQSGVCACHGLMDWGLLIGMLHGDGHGSGRVAHSRTDCRSTHFCKLRLSYLDAQALVRVVPLLFSQVSEGTPYLTFDLILRPDSSTPLQTLWLSDVHSY